MKTFALGGIALFVCAAAARSALAQAPAPIRLEPPGPLGWVEGPGAAPPLPAPASPPPAPLWSVDLVLGLPTALRAQRMLTEHIAVEGLAGFEIIFPFVGAGLRSCHAPLSGAHDALCVNPGVDAYLLADWLPGGSGLSRHSGLLAMASADVDVLWRHNFENGCQCQIGVKLGAAVAGANRGVVLPVIGVFGGWRF